MPVQKKFLEPVMNAILVDQGLRLAMLVQPIDYNETSSKDPITKSVLHTIHTHFPELQQSEEYNGYQGILVSPVNYNGKTLNDEQIGEILGYPCNKEFQYLSQNDSTYMIRVIAYINNEEYELFSNKCKDSKRISEFALFAKHSEKLLNLSQYNALLGSDPIKVRVKAWPVIPTKALLNKLIKHEHLDKDDMNAIRNIFLNFSFSKSFTKYFEDTFQPENRMHIGILIGVLLNERNQPLSAFFPLDHYPSEASVVKTIVEEWESELRFVLGKTFKSPKSRNSTRKHKRKIRKHD